MTRHPHAEHVATRGCEALGSLTQDHQHNAGAALNAGAVKAVLVAMRAFSAAVQLLARGCCALSNISGLAGTLGGTLADGAAIDVAVAAMRAHAGERELQRHGCNLLSCIFSSGDEKTDGSWARRGTSALAVVVAALKAHREHADLLDAGCAAISSLMSSIDGNRHAAVASGAIEAVVAALRAFPAAAQLQVGGLTALCMMCPRIRNNQLAAAAAGGWMLLSARCARIQRARPCSTAPALRWASWLMMCRPTKHALGRWAASRRWWLRCERVVTHFLRIAPHSLSSGAGR
jgi:hypothetical protein